MAYAKRISNMIRVVEYDKPVQVNQAEYIALMQVYAGRMCGRRHGDHYYIKLWFMGKDNKNKKAIEAFLNRPKPAKPKPRYDD